MTSAPGKRLALKSLILFLLFLCPTVATASSDPSPGLAADPATPGTGDAYEPLRRIPDPVFITGDTLPAGFLGTEIGKLRLFRNEAGTLVPIRFQVDERTDKGDWIFPFGKRSNLSRSNGRLDSQDVILFMARDAGPEAEGLGALPGPDSIIDIELEDPVDGGRGWVCLARYGEQPPPPLCPLPDFVQYDAENEIISSACTRAQYIITEDGLHTTFYKHHSTPPSVGGSGENLVDRLKLRINMRFFFNLVPLSVQEERLGSDKVAYIQGPIRNLRRYEQFVKLPFGIRGVKTFADVEQYEGFATVPISLQVPRGFHRVVSSARIRYGTDYSPNMIGSFFRNSREKEALIIDGRMSEAEKHFPSAQDRWRIVYGPYGVLMTRTIFPPELLEMVEISHGYLDDMETPMPPERFPGSIGYAYTDILATDVRSGKYRLSLDFYFPPHYQPGDEQRYLQIRDNPLKIRIGDKETENPQGLFGKVGKDF
jgi:hypothetical protein